MVKVRIQLVPEFGPESGEVKWSGAVEASYSGVIQVVQRKLKLKEMNLVTLYYEDGGPGTRRILPHGCLGELLQKDMRILVSLGQALRASTSAAADPGPGNETALSKFDLPVIMLSGESFTVAVRSSETIGSVKAKIQESQGVRPHKQRLLLAEAEPPDESGLADIGVSATTPLQLVVMNVNGFDIRLAGMSGANTPRFGCTSTYTWEMKCECGHTETWGHVDGYDFWSMSKQLAKLCPRCGGTCLTKAAGPSSIPTEFPP